MDAIVVEDLHKRYKDVQALDGVSFAVREGEVFGLLGPNGAGKSTTVRTLATLTQPDSGRALVAGEDVVRHPEPRAARDRLRRAGLRRRLGGDRPREPAAAGTDPRHGGRDRCARASTSCSSSSG